MLAKFSDQAKTLYFPTCNEQCYCNRAVWESSLNTPHSLATKLKTRSFYFKMTNTIDESSLRPTQGVVSWLDTIMSNSASPAIAIIWEDAHIWKISYTSIYN